MQSSSYQRFLKGKLCCEMQIASIVSGTESALVGITGDTVYILFSIILLYFLYVRYSLLKVLFL